VPLLLQNLAYMFKRLEPINTAKSANEPQLFPQGQVGLPAASEVPVDSLRDLEAYINKVEAADKRYIWATDASSSMMLWPFDSPTAAVADLIEVSYDQPSNSITLEVDVVDKPITISEFQPHQRQTLDVHHAHYHFETPKGVNINAHALLNKLEASKYKVKGKG
jgi:hypothetical protein